jgi:hypothetical protein
MEVNTARPSVVRRVWSRRWVRRLVKGGAITVVAIALIGYVVAPPIARRVAETQLSTLLGRKVTIGRIRINPFALSLAVERFQVYEADQTTPFFGFGRLYVNAQLSSIVRRGPVVKEIALEALRLHVVRTQATADAWADVAGAYNFSDIVQRLTAGPEKPPAPPATEPPRFSLNNIHFHDWAITFDDKPTGDHHEVSELAIGVPFASTLPVYVDAFVEPGLSVKIDGTPFVLKGRTKPFKNSLETVLEVRLKDLDLTKYLPFVPVHLPVAVTSARFSLALDVGFVRSTDASPKLTVAGDVGLDGLDVREKRKAGLAPLVGLRRLAVHVGASDVTAQQFHVETVAVSGLDVHLRRLRDGTLNVEHLSPEGGGAPARKAATNKPAPAKTGGREMRFALDAFTLDGTVVHFRDESVEPAFETTVRDVAISVKGLSNAPGVTSKVQAGLRAVPGAVVGLAGTLRLSPLMAAGKLTVDDIEPARFGAYTRELVAFDVVSGKARVAAGYLFSQERGKTTVRIEDGSFGLDDLALRRRGARDDFFRLAALAVRGVKLDLGARTVEVAEIATHEGRVRAVRDAKGVVDLTTLVAAAPAPERPPAPVAAAPAADSAPPWTVTLSRFALERWGARFEDRAVSPTAVLTVDPIGLQLTNVSTAPGTKLGFDLRLGVNKTGKITVTGNSTLPAAGALAANVRFDLRGLELLPFQPYFQDQVSLTVAGGSIGLKGQAAVKTAPNAEPKLDVTADLEVADVAAVERATKEPLVGWKSFHVAAAHVTTSPLAVAIGEVSLTDFHARAVLTPDGGMNLAEAFAKPGAAAAPPAVASKAGDKKGAAAQPAPAPPVAMTVGQVTLRGGQVTFVDRSIKPAFTAELADFGGRLTGLSSTPGTTAEVDLRGAVNRSGALTIAGKVNPLAKELALDVQTDLRDVELPPASPYTGRYAGYLIGKGKLDLALAYKIADRKLEARNKLVLDQFAFGDKTDSPDATKMPVRLAVALLKDRKGVIDIDLPISGSLDDPQFKVWPAVLKVFGNLIVKAATAPFSLIASAFGGGDELSHVDFAPGLTRLDAVAEKRLGTLAKVLHERPGISFELEGGADAAQDREGLRRFLFERALKAKKLAALVKDGAAVAAVDDLTIDPGERPALLATAWDEAKIAKPKNGLGLEKSLPPDEKERLLLASTRVEDDDLRALALRRATMVQSSLAKQVPGGASRLFLVTPRLGGGRVELKLKRD